MAEANLARAGFASVSQVRRGPAAETQLTAPGSVIVADNVVRQGAVVDPSSEDANVRGVREFAELVAADPQPEATVSQTVASKGYDSFLFALVTH